MSNPAFIVDGFTEQKIIQNLCPGQPIRRTDLNGRDVTIAAIAKKIASLIRLLGNRYYPIIVLTDKEQRQLSFEEMATQIRDALAIEGCGDQDIRIGVADRMIENWILADWVMLTGNHSKPIETDGLNGAAIIRKHKGTYNKTTDGVQMYLNASPIVMYENSPSFRHFIETLQGVNCEYLNYNSTIGDSGNNDD